MVLTQASKLERAVSTTWETEEGCDPRLERLRLQQRELSSMGAETRCKGCLRVKCRWPYEVCSSLDAALLGMG